MVPEAPQAQPRGEPGNEVADARFRPFVAVLLLGGLLAALATGEPPRPVVARGPDGVEVAVQPYAEIERIDVFEAKSRLAAGTATFIDVRDQAEYQAGHIPGALWLPVDRVSSLRGVEPGAEIVTYCA